MPFTTTSVVRRAGTGLLALGILALGSSSLLGCEDMGGRRMPVNKQETTPADTPASKTGEVRQSSSTLGKARDSAVRVGDKVDDYNRRIEEAAEGVGK